jgi:peptidyl-prolyl cis-trans isomerase C
MDRTIRALMIVASFAVLLAGCSSGPSGQDKILVSVGNKFITLNDYRQKLSKLPSYYQGMAEKNKKTLLDDMIVESLFLEDAFRKGIDKDKEVRDILEEAKKKIIVAKFMKTEVDDKIKISEEDMKKYYESHKDEYKKPEMWRASHILLANEAEAKGVQAALLNGKNFQELAKERSIDATATRGGDVGYFRKGQVVPEFENACFALDVGQTSPIIHTQFGYHIIRLTDKKAESQQSFEEARPMIENDLRIGKRNELFGKLVQDLKNKYRVRVEDDAMKAINAVNGKKEDRPKEDNPKAKKSK